MLDKQNRYTTAAMWEASRHGRLAGLAQHVLSPLLRFVKFHVLQLGVLDGVTGLVHIVIGSGNSFAKYAKMLAFHQSCQ